VIAMQPLSDAQVQKYKLPSGQWMGAEVRASRGLLCQHL